MGAEWIGPLQGDAMNTRKVLTIKCLHKFYKSDNPPPSGWGQLRGEQPHRKVGDDPAANRSELISINQFDQLGGAVI